MCPPHTTHRRERRRRTEQRGHGQEDLHLEHHVQGQVLQDVHELLLLLLLCWHLRRRRSLLPHGCCAFLRSGAPAPLAVVVVDPRHVCLCTCLWGVWGVQHEIGRAESQHGRQEGGTCDGGKPTTRRASGYRAIGWTRWTHGARPRSNRPPGGRNSSQRPLPYVPVMLGHLYWASEPHSRRSIRGGASGDGGRAPSQRAISVPATARELEIAETIEFRACLQAVRRG